MFKVIVLAALAISAVCAQEAPAPVGGEAAPEPYSYGYETDSHAAQEQRDPNGRVTGFYTLADADGRQRRVEYYADESGFHAKVQTNEVGTKTGNSADVEVQASEPNQEQYIYRQQEQQQVVPAPVQKRVVTQQFVTAPPKSAAVSYVQQPTTYAYNQGYSYYPQTQSAYYTYPVGYGVANQQYGYGTGYGTSYGTGYGATYGGYGNYNNHLPSSYYRSVNTVQAAPAAVRSGYYQTAPQVSARSAGSYQVVGVPSGAVSYQTVGVPAGSVSYQSSGVPTTGSSVGNLLGSSNYQVLKKRETDAEASSKAEQK